MWCTFDEDIELPAPGVAPEGGVDDLVRFCIKRIGFVPEPRQMEVLLTGSRRVILNCSRQWGKSTLAAAMAVHRIYTRPGCLVIVASPTARQSGELVYKAGLMVSRMGDRVRGDGMNDISLLLSNGSRIVGLPGKDATVRGFSAVSLMLVDEATRVTDALYKALRPMLAVGGGDLWIMSTPMGKRGFFYEAWVREADWTRIESPVTECPHISPEFIEEERREHGDSWVRQEFFCEFADNGTELFGRDLVEAALEDMGEWKTCRGSIYIGVDLGKTQDFTAIAIVEREEQALAWMPTAYKDLRVRHLERVPLGTPYTLVVERIRNICLETSRRGRCHLVVDATGVGAPVVDMLRQAGLACGMTAVSITGSGRGGASSVPKRDLLSGVQLALEKGELRIARGLKQAKSLVRELIHMRMDGGQGEHDDLVIALALACWGSRRGEVGPRGMGLPGI